MKNGRKIYIFISWLLVVTCMGIIFSLSAQAAEESQELSDSLIDKILELLGLEFASDFIRTLAHCLEFTGLSFLISNAVYVSWELKTTPVIAVAGTVLYAVADEIHQLFVPGRAFQFSDILVDSTGALIGAVAFLIILKIILTIKERRNKNGSTQTL